MELRLEVRTRVDVSRDQHEIQVISVGSAGVPFKVIQSPDASCYSGSAQQFPRITKGQQQISRVERHIPIFEDKIHCSPRLRDVRVKYQ